MVLTERLENARMIRESVGAIASAKDLKRVRARRFHDMGLDRTIWREIAELGWLALRLDESAGGLGLGVRELAAICEELGSALAPEPVAAVAAIIPYLDKELSDQVQSGDKIVVPAWVDSMSDSRNEHGARLEDNRVTGTKILVPFVDDADIFLVTTRDGAALVNRDARGVSVFQGRTQDGSELGTVTFDHAEAVPVEGDLSFVLHELGLYHAAYLLGASERAFAMTLDYLGVRKQFGRLIGSFQALQHRAAEAKIQLAISRAVLDEAIDAADDRLAFDVQVSAASRALARVSDTAMLIARESIQMHGAIGITDEHDIGLYCRKILSCYNLFGTATVHRRRYLETAGIGSEE